MIEQFHQPRTVRQALDLKRKFKGQSAFFAGGTFINSNDCLLPPKHCISLAGLHLDGIAQKNKELVIGALCTLQQLLDEKKVPAPLKAAAAQFVNRNLRNMATIGGHIAYNQPHSDLIPMLAALEARVVLAGGTTPKSVPIMDYVKTAGPELITQIVIPKLAAKRAAVCMNLRPSANSRSVVSVAVSMTVDQNAVRDPIIAVAGVAKRVVRLTAVERAIDGKAMLTTDDLQELVSSTVKPSSDVLASAALRAHQAGAAVALACEQARSQIGDAP